MNGVLQGTFVPWRCFHPNGRKQERSRTVVSVVGKKHFECVYCSRFRPSEGVTRAAALSPVAARDPRPLFQKLFNIVFLRLLLIFFEILMKRTFNP